MAEILQFPNIIPLDQSLKQAVGAENLSISPVIFPLAEVIPLYNPEAEAFCISADTIPGVALVRQQARAEAQRILETNRQQLMIGNFSAVPLDVDAVGTAAKVAAVEEHFGTNSEEHLVARSGLVRDCSRKWAEAFRKNTYEYFEPTVQDYDTESDKLFADGLCVDEMLQNGLSPVAESEEAELRINDFVNSVTNKLLLQRKANQPHDAIRLTQCPDWAIKSLHDNPKGAHGGYAPENKKLMVSFDWFDSDKQQIYHEQVGVAGKYITNEVINEAYQQVGFTNKGQHLTKTEIHLISGLAPTGTIVGALDFVKILDTIASEKCSKNVFMGEEVTPEHLKDYQAVLQEAADRRVQQEALSEELASYVEELYDDGIDRAAATVLVEQYIQKEMLSQAEASPELAKIVFNKETADGFRKAEWLSANGFHREADLQRELVRQNAPAASSCGAGSCGLEALDPTKTPDKKAKELLDVRSDETVLKDTERMCTDCGERSVYYAFTKSKVKKACTNCEKTENVVRKYDNKKTPRSKFTFLSDNKTTELFNNEKLAS